MDQLTLSATMRVGHGQIDAGHSELIEIVNRCLTLVEASSPARHCYEVLEELRAKFVQHIDEEEAIMEELGYPDMAGEKAEHINGMEKLNQLVDACTDGVDLNALLAEVTGLLLVVFIKSDMGFKNYLQSIDYRDEAPI